MYSVGKEHCQNYVVVDVSTVLPLVSILINNNRHKPRTNRMIKYVQRVQRKVRELFENQPHCLYYGYSLYVLYYINFEKVY